MILEEMKAIASRTAGNDVTRAIVTVPTNFDMAQRKATEDACEIAGLNCIRIVNEPTAASIAYGLQEELEDDEERSIVVFDLGGSKLDVSILTVSDGLIDVQATSGNPYLGGRDFDNVLIDKCIAEFKRNFDIDLRVETPENMVSIQRLRQACEKAKCELSTESNTEIRVS